MLALRRACAGHGDPTLLSEVSYNPLTQMSELGGVPFIDAHGEALASTTHTTVVINSEDGD
ncbi:hypothetical protein ABT095_14355 [Kitasatospora sp. NPDC002227]|uniref:hypothetical protein n=1 Tax=Kitasatospora sp. NPDC002227 TaxID=3154773 RepID=UPI00331D649A